MTRDLIVPRIQSIERELLGLSERVGALRDLDSMNAWIEAVLTKEPDLARRLRLPTQAATKKALLTIVKSQSVLT